MARKPQQPGRNRKLLEKAAKNLAKGMVVEEALVDAGYSPNTARSHGYKIAKQARLQSIFTDACERIMQKKQKDFDAIVEPYFEALEAKVIVKSQQLGDAQEVDLPDHATRMQAADRIVGLYGGGAKPTADDGSGGSVTIIINQFCAPEESVTIIPKGPSNA